MQKNKNIYFTVLISFIFLFACKQPANEGYNPPKLTFKTTAGYIYTDTTIIAGGAILIGLIAERGLDGPLKSADDLSNVIIKMSTNGGSEVAVYEYVMTTAEAAYYEYDYNAFATAIVGDSVRYNIVVYNKDGYIDQKDLTIISD